MRKQRALKPVCIEFYDHIANNAEALDAYEKDGKESGAIQAFGVIYKQTKLAYYLASWVRDGEIITADTDAYKILRSTVRRVTRLGPVALKTRRLR